MYIIKNLVWTLPNMQALQKNLNMYFYTYHFIEFCFQVLDILKYLSKYYHSKFRKRFIHSCNGFFRIP